MSKARREGEGIAYAGRRLHPNEVLRLGSIDAAEYSVAEMMRAYLTAQAKGHSTAATKHWTAYENALARLERLRDEKHKQEQTELEGMADERLDELILRTLHELPMESLDRIEAAIQEMRKPRLVVSNDDGAEGTG